MRPALLFDDAVPGHRRAPRALRVARRRSPGAGSPISTRCRSTPGRPATSPIRSRTAAGSCGVSPTTARSRPTTGTRDRSKACSPRWTPPASRFWSSRTSERCRLPEERGSYLPEDNQPLRDGPPPPRDHPAGGGQLHARVEPAHLATLVDAHLDAPPRGPGAPHRRLRRRWRDPCRSSIAPRSARWSSPTATPTRCTAGRTPSTSASGASAGWPTRSSSAATASGEITYLDAVLCSEHGRPYVVKNAVCIHEEDYGILWKHQDQHAGRTEVRRSRRLVVSSIATVGNYEYGFYWYFYLDGTIQHEVKLTGVMSTQAILPDEEPTHGSVIAPGLAAPFHQHLFCAAARPRGRRTGQRGPRGLRRARAARRGQPARATPSASGAERLESELGARRDIDPANGRHWRFVNPASRNGLGRPVAYKLVPGPTPTLLATADSSVGQRAGFRTPQPLGHSVLAATSGGLPATTPTSTLAGDGLPGWTEADRSLARHRARRLAHLRRDPRAAARRTGR